jgi:glucose/arabinose dehydrogenase
MTRDRTVVVVKKDSTRQQAPAAIQVKPTAFAQGLQKPTAIAATGDTADRRLFVTEQDGTVQVVDEQGKLGTQPFLDIRSKVLVDSEMGLLGMAFHPKYQENGYFYVYYINKSKQSVLARFKLDATTGRADAKSEKVILTLQQSYTNHKGGQVAFGPDGFLYLGLGDGGSGGDPDDNGQDKNTWFGKVLRLDIDKGDPYSIPASNPFATTKDAKPEVWAWGLRNPWRFSFDRTTHDLYIGDVGQSKYEEIDFQKASSKGGENYGWRCYEGQHVFNTDGCMPAEGYVQPIVEYAHEAGRCSVTGGYVYRGSLQSKLVGTYFYGDLCTGEIFAASQQTGAWKTTLAGTSPASITTFGEDNSGELYFADAKAGAIYRLEDASN